MYTHIHTAIHTYIQQLTRTPTHTHTQTCVCALRHMLVKYTLSSRNKKYTECQAYSRHTCNNFMAWQRPRPARSQTAGAMKSEGKSELKRTRTRETSRKMKPERSNIKIHDTKHKTKSDWPGIATKTTKIKKIYKSKKNKNNSNCRHNDLTVRNSQASGAGGQE